MSLDKLVDSTFKICKAGYEVDTQDYIQKADKFEEDVKKKLKQQITKEIEHTKYRTLNNIDKFFGVCSDDIRKRLGKLKSRSRLAYHEVLNRKETDMTEFAADMREIKEKCIQKLARPSVLSEIELDLLFLEMNYRNWIEKMSLALVKKIKQEKRTRSLSSARKSHGGVSEILLGFNAIGLAFLRMIELQEKMVDLKDDDKRRTLKGLAYWDLDTLIQWTQTISQEEIDLDELNSDQELLNTIWG